MSLMRQNVSKILYSQPEDAVRKLKHAARNNNTSQHLTGDAKLTEK